MHRVEVISRLERELARLKERYGVASLALFGSSARGDAGPTSDVDLLVEFHRPITLFDLVEVQQYLESRLDGVRVDLVPSDSIYAPFRDAITRDAINVL